MPLPRKKSNLALYLEAQKAAKTAPPAQPQISDLRRYLAMGARGAGVLAGLTPLRGIGAGAIGEAAGEYIGGEEISPLRIAAAGVTGGLGGGLVTRLGKLLGQPIRAGIEGAILSGASPIAKSLIERQEMPEASEVATAAALGGGTGWGLTKLLGRGAKVVPPPTPLTDTRTPAELLKVLESQGGRIGPEAGVAGLAGRPLAQTPEIQAAMEAATPMWKGKPVFPQRPYGEKPYEMVGGRLENPELQALSAPAPPETSTLDAIKPFLQAAKTQARVAKAQALPTQIGAREAVAVGRDVAVAEKAAAAEAKLFDQLQAAEKIAAEREGLVRGAPRVTESFAAPIEGGTERATISYKRPPKAGGGVTPLGKLLTAEPAAAARTVPAIENEVKFAGWGEGELVGGPPQPYFDIPIGKGQFTTGIGEKAVLDRGLPLPSYPPFNAEAAAAASAAKADKIAELFGYKAPVAQTTAPAREAFLADQQAQIAAQQAATEPAITTPLTKLLNIAPETPGVPVITGMPFKSRSASLGKENPFGYYAVQEAYKAGQAPKEAARMLGKFLRQEGKAEEAAAAAKAAGAVPPPAARAVEAAVPEVAPAVASSDDWIKTAEAELADLEAAKLAVPAAPAAAAINPGRALFQSLKDSQKGATSPKLLARLGLGTAGALAGGAMTPEDPLTGAVMGGVAGAAIPSIPGIVAGFSKMGVPAKTLAGIETAVQTSGGIKEAARRIAADIPNFQRFNYLASPAGLPANAWAGPYGSAYMAAIEHVLSGDSRGWQVMREMTPAAFLREWKTSIPEAADLIRHASSGQTIGRAETAGLAEGAGEGIGGLEGVLAMPGVAMTAGDVAARRFLTRAGFAEDEARTITLTSQPFTRTGQGWAGMRGWLVSLLAPFRRTPTNIVEQGALRTPGLGFMAQASGAPPAALRQQLVRQGMGLGVGVGAEQIGEHMSPEQARVWRRYLTNVGGQYSAPVAVGFTVGQARQAGRPVMQGLGRGITQALPLPTTDTITDLFNFLQKPSAATVPRGAYPAAVREWGGPLLKILRPKQATEFDRLFPKVK